MSSDHSEVEEEDPKTKLSVDSTKLPMTKRSHTDSGDEDKQDIPAKKRRHSSSKESEMLEKNNTSEIISDKNGISENNLKNERGSSFEDKSDLNENSSLDTNEKIKSEEDQEDKLTKIKNQVQNSLKNESNFTMDESPATVKEETISEDSPSKRSNDTKTTSTSDNEKTEEDNIVDEIDDYEENSKGNKTKEKHIVKSRSTDTEVVDGLELSVECASDKEGSSSDSADEKEKKPRPKTVIVKAEPNESELECGSSDDEKSDVQEASNTVETKSKKRKRRNTRTNFSKLKASGSEDSQNNNSDEDYSPRTKKKLKKLPTTKRSTKRSTESKRGRGGGIRKNVHKGSTEDASDDEDSDTISADKNDKTTKKDEAEEELSGKESPVSKSDSKSNSDDEEKSTKGRKTRRSNIKPEDNKRIQSLKKYIKAAGVRVKSYQEIWADCRTNTDKINRLKELLEKKGVTGRPTLEKCKRARKKNEKMQEISELDTSNIISEGRVTRARRNMESNKKPIIVGTPPRHREARNTFKRLQTVVDSDSD